MTQIDQTNQPATNTSETTITAAADNGAPPAKPKSNRGFASMDPARQREIASKGGHASGGNFANNRERAADAGRKGGQASSGQRQTTLGTPPTGGTPSPEERH